MAWWLLLLAGLLEVVWAFALKQSAGFSRLDYSLLSLLAMVASVLLLGLALRSLPLGTAYAIWTGLGAVGAVAVGWAVFDEPASLMRMTAAALIIAGLVLMRLAG